MKFILCNLILTSIAVTNGNNNSYVINQNSPKSDVLGDQLSYDNGWMPFQDNKTIEFGNYILHVDRHKWNQAKLLCISEGGQLVVPENIDETKRIVAFLNDRRSRRLIDVYIGAYIGAYIGVYYDYDDFRTVDGRGFEQLLPDLVKKIRKQETSMEGKCVVMVNGTMELVLCEEKLPYMCKKYANPGCETQDSAYFLHDDQTSCYKVHTKQTVWQKASDICTSEDSYLAIPNSQKKIDFLMKNLDKVGDSRGIIHAGFNDKNTEGEYVTVDGKLLIESGDMSWNKGRPDIRLGMNKDCGTIVKHNGGTLNDGNCNDTEMFICEHYVGDGSIYDLLKRRALFQKSSQNSNTGNREEPFTNVLAGQRKDPIVDVEEWETFQENKVIELGDYRLHLEPHGWNQAKILCMSEGGQLVVPEDIDEIKRISAVLTDKLPSSLIGAYLGVYHDYDEFRTVDGRDFRNLFRDWVDKISNKETSMEGKCVVMVKSIMELVSCEEQLPYLCKKYANPACETQDSGYVLFGDRTDASCYKMHKTPALWQEASDICTSENSYLAIPKSRKEAIFMVNTIDKYKEKNEYKQKTTSVANFRPSLVFVGFNDIIEEGKYVTVDGEALSNSRMQWNGNQPDNKGNNEDCGSIFLTSYSDGDHVGNLNDVNCNRRAIFMCERYVGYRSIYNLLKTKKRELFPKEPEYRLHKDKKNIDAAKMQCKNEMSQLVVPENPTEARYIWNNFEHSLPANSHGVWTGISLSKIEGEEKIYRTIDGRKLETLGLQWASGEPNSNRNDSCVELSFAGKLNDVPCHAKMPYVCKKKSNPDCDAEDISYFPDKTSRSCYKLHLEVMNWKQAQSQCLLEGSVLAVLNTIEEGKLLAEELLRHSKDIDILAGYSWIQAFVSLQREERIFFFNSGDLMWAKMIPTDKNDGHCRTITQKGRPNHFSCGIALPFICERYGITDIKGHQNIY